MGLKQKTVKQNLAIAQGLFFNMLVAIFRNRASNEKHNLL
jgi:hypothetical protein